MAMAMFLNLIAVASTLKGVHGLISLNVNDICSSTPNPTIHLPSETLVIPFPISLTLPHQCDIVIKSTDYNGVIVESMILNSTAVTFPCDWLSVTFGKDYGTATTSMPTRWYVCGILDAIHWHKFTPEHDTFTLTVNPTNGVERTGQFSFILSKKYYHCTNYSDNLPVGYCCKHGANETAADFVLCGVDTPGDTGSSCIYKNMVCDGVVNCWELWNEEKGCDLGVAMSGGGGGGGGAIPVGVGMWVGVVVVLWGAAVGRGEGA